MKCCGEKRESNFCPVCGKQLGRQSPLKAVLAYCRSQQSAAEKRVQWLVDNPREKESTQKSYLSQRGKLVDKWKSWADAIEAALEAAVSTNDIPEESL